MTILAGIFSPDCWSPQDQGLADEIRIHISRAATDARQVFCDDTLFVCKVDIGAYGQPAWHETPTGFATLVGRPLLGGPDRQSDLETLNCPDPGPRIVAGCHGAFCAVIYDRTAGQLRLLTDPLGLRPFFVYAQPGRWLFSTSLRVLQSLSIDLALDLNGVAEVATLGYFLLDHTPYAEVTGAPPAACWTFDRTGLKRADYPAWTDLDEVVPRDEGVAAIHRACESALTAALVGGDGTAVVSLSGSLNSNLIAAALRRRGVRVFGVAADAGDAVSGYCAAAFAEANAIPLTKVNSAGGFMSLEERLGRHWDQSATLPNLPTPRPHLVWTGKGGSVGTGTMALSPADADLARWGDAAKLVDRWMQRADINLPPRIVVNFEILEANLRSNLIAAVGAFPGLSQVRSLMLLLSVQHQRRHQVLQREDIDRHRIELQVPLSSPQVARTALTLAVPDLTDGTVFRLLLECHYPEVIAAPWRSSPGQLPCPWPIPSAVKGRMGWLKQDPRRRATLSRAWRLVREWPVPPGVLHRPGFAITLALTAAHVREGIYSLQRAEAFARWLHR